jgi:hypothetical protein
MVLAPFGASGCTSGDDGGATERAGIRAFTPRFRLGRPTNAIVRVPSRLPPAWAVPHANVLEEKTHHAAKRCTMRVHGDTGEHHGRSTILGTDGGHAAGAARCGQPHQWGDEGDKGNGGPTDQTDGATVEPLWTTPLAEGVDGLSSDTWSPQAWVTADTLVFPDGDTMRGVDVRSGAERWRLRLPEGADQVRAYSESVNETGVGGVLTLDGKRILQVFDDEGEPTHQLGGGGSPSPCLLGTTWCGWTRGWRSSSTRGTRSCTPTTCDG